MKKQVSKPAEKKAKHADEKQDKDLIARTLKRYGIKDKK